MKCNIFRKVMLIISLAASGNVWSNETTDFKELLDFTEGEYILTSGEHPCTIGYVGWGTFEESSIFKLGAFTAFTGINEGLLKKPADESGDCEYDSMTTLKKNEIEEVENTICPDEKIKRRALLSVYPDKLQYSVVVNQNGKTLHDITCIYSLDKESSTVQD